MLDRALRLRSRGFSVIPIVYRDKRPAVPWRWYQSHHATRERLEAWFGGPAPCNLGIVCGAVSGVVVVDVDSPAAWTWAVATLPASPMRTRTARGQHWFYRHPGGTVPNRARVGALALDVRGDGGYVLGPGSLHPLGVLYEAIGEWPAIDDLPMFRPEWLAEPEHERPVPASGTTRRRVSGRNALVWL